MKSSILILSFFSLGMIIGRLRILPEFVQNYDIAIGLVYLLVFFIGISIGAEMSILKSIRKQGIRILFIPAAIVVGSFTGIVLASLFFSSYGLKDLIAISSGFGYYSLSAVLVKQFSGDETGALCLLTNLFRELITLILAPLLVKYFGKLAPVASGGATAMDTTLPVILQNSGKEFALTAIFSGLVLSSLVPWLIPLIYKF